MLHRVNDKAVFGVHHVLIVSLDLSEPSTVPAPSTPTTTSGTDNSKSTATDDTFDSGSKKSNAGAIAGGVLGALAGLTLVGAAALFALRHRFRRSSAPRGGWRWARTVHSADAQSWEKSPETSMSTHRFYVRRSISCASLVGHTRPVCVCRCADWATMCSHAEPQRP